MSDKVTTRWRLERSAITRLKDNEQQRLNWEDVASPLARAAVLRAFITSDPTIYSTGWKTFVDSCSAALPYWVQESNTDLVSALQKLTGKKKVEIESYLAALSPDAILALRQKPQVQAILNPVELSDLL